MRCGSGYNLTWLFRPITRYYRIIPDGAGTGFGLLTSCWVRVQPEGMTVMPLFIIPNYCFNFIMFSWMKTCNYFCFPLTRIARTLLQKKKKKKMSFFPILLYPTSPPMYLYSLHILSYPSNYVLTPIHSHSSLSSIFMNVVSLFLE